MSELIYSDRDEITSEGETCPNCESTRTGYNANYGYWECSKCNNVWGHDKDDPDYDEAEICPTCKGSGVNGTEGNIALDAVDECDINCPTCGGSGYV